MHLGKTAFLLLTEASGGEVKANINPLD